MAALPIIGLSVLGLLPFRAATWLPGATSREACFGKAAAASHGKVPKQKLNPTVFWNAVQIG